MNIGQSVKTLPTVKPKLYAGKTGVIATKNEDELGVLINGRVVWFLEGEIEECANANHVQESSVQRAGGKGVVTDQPREARPAPSDSPLTNPSSPVPGSRGGSPLNGVSAAPGGSGGLSGLIPGERGPGGGVVALCGRCGEAWERPKERGRPALMCGGCR